MAMKCRGAFKKRYKLATLYGWIHSETSSLRTTIATFILSVSNNKAKIDEFVEQTQTISVNILIVRLEHLRNHRSSGIFILKFEKTLQENRTGSVQARNIAFFR